MIEYN